MTKSAMNETDKLTIEKGVPIPPRRIRQRGFCPFGEMGVGDSFLVPLDEATAKVRATRYGMAGNAWARKHRSIAPSHRFRSAQVKGGVRCWRVA